MGEGPAIEVLYELSGIDAIRAAEIDARPEREISEPGRVERVARQEPHAREVDAGLAALDDIGVARKGEVEPHVVSGNPVAI